MTAVAELETPFLAIERPRLAANLARVRAIAERAGVRLRPHVKTHKSLELARAQMGEGGAFGITASKSEEALVFIEAGVASVTVAYPVIDPRKLDRLLARAKAHGTDLRLIADSEALVAAAEAAAARAGLRLALFVKVDVGLGRIGVDPKGEAALDLARRIASSGSLRFQGLLSHAGQAYAAADRAAIAAIAEAERLTLIDLAERLRRAGLEPAELSVGSTPTVLAAERFDGLTEIRPGNYAFMDLTQARLGVASLEEVALTVQATVVSRNRDWLIVDAGSKVLSSDSGAHGTGGAGFGRAFGPGLPEEGLIVARLSEEHGWIARAGAEVAVGDRLGVIPNHACPVANLLGEAWLVEDGAVLERWTLQAAARVR